MFWRMTGLSTASPVDSILDKGSFNLEELLDEDEIIQECKVLNSRLINFWVQLQLQNYPDELCEDGVKDYLSHASHIMKWIVSCLLQYEYGYTNACQGYKMMKASLSGVLIRKV